MKGHKGGEKSQVNYKSSPRAIRRTHKFQENSEREIEQSKEKLQQSEGIFPKPRGHEFQEESL